MPSTERRSFLKRAEAFGRALETGLLFLLLFSIIGLATLEIVLRNVFSIGLFWADDLMQIAIIWLAVIAAVAAARDDRHLSINLVARYCPETWHIPAGLFAYGFATVVASIMGWHSYRFVVDTWFFGDTVFGEMPAWMFQSILPVGFFLISYRFLLRSVAYARKAIWR